MADDGIVMEKGLEGIEFFGEVDKVGGKIGSEYPAWYYDTQAREIKDSITRTERELENGLIPERGKPAAMAELRKAKEKYDRIMESRPELSDRMKDEINKSTEYIGKQLKDMKFTRTEEQKGLVDAHVEVERMYTPCVKVDERTAAIAKKIGCKIYDGKITGLDAEKVWKISRKLIGESSNSEVLRRI